MSEQAAPADPYSVQDVELRRLRRELATAKAQLDQLHGRKSGLMAMAVHDLRTPLAIIQGYSQLLAADLTEPAPDIREYLVNIIAHADSLGNMVENIVALDQLEYGTLRLAITAADLNDLTAQAIAQVEGLTVVKNLTVEHRPASQAILVQADEGHVRRALYNLLSHATKYARPGSTIQVEVTSEGDYAAVSLVDPQRALRSEILDHLFDLVEINREGGTSLHGTDLGLVLTRQVAEAHGGRVEASCELGGGTTLTLYLPAMESLSAPQEDGYR